MNVSESIKSGFGVGAVLLCISSVQSVTLNGRNHDRAWLTHEEIIRGGTLEFVMGPEPNRKWAAANPDIPAFSKIRR